MRVEISARHFIQLEGKLVSLEPHEAACQLINGIIGNGQRAVAAGIRDLEVEILIELFAGPQRDHGFFPSPII